MQPIWNSQWTCALLGLAASVAVSEMTSGQEWQWDVVSVDTGGDVGQYARLVLDTNDHPRIAYYDATRQALKYAAYDGTNWNVATVDRDGDVGSHCTLVLDSAGWPHIGYHGVLHGDLKYARFDGTNWLVETASAQNIVGRFASLALDSFDRPRLSYFSTTDDDLRYAYKVPVGFWRRLIADAGPGVGWYTSLKLDGAGGPHISYYDYSNQVLKCASYSGATWTVQTVDSDGPVGKYTSLALGVDGRPHVSYFYNRRQDLRYARFTGSNWVIQTAVPDRLGGKHTSLALDPTGRPRISFLNSDQDRNGLINVRIAWFEGSEWLLQTVVDNPMPTNAPDPELDEKATTSLALDRDGNPRIAYYDLRGGDLKYAVTRPVGRKLWDNATPLGFTGWKQSDWFGYFWDPDSDGWIWHAQHGWLACVGDRESDIWMYAEDLGWLWTGKGIYPWIWRDDAQAWLYYYRETVPRRFWNHTLQRIETH
jgi:hypothetical protein